MKTINNFKGDFGFLSNFYHTMVKYEDEWFHSVENAYQAAKVDKQLRGQFKMVSPGKAKRMGRKAIMIDGFELNKLDVMYQLVKSKFSRNDIIKFQLIETGDAELIEGNTWGDTFWGVCRGEGHNHLGKILMRVRAELIEANET